VRGVKTASVDRTRDEAWVVRQVGQASDGDLLRAVVKAGYSAYRLPIEAVSIDVSDMDCGGCPQRVRAAIQRVEGVRTVMLRDERMARVYFDARRASPGEILDAVRTAGFAPREVR
jgi:copper chaperone CopZ